MKTTLVIIGLFFLFTCCAVKRVPVEAAPEQTLSMEEHVTEELDKFWADSSNALAVAVTGCTGERNSYVSFNPKYFFTGAALTKYVTHEAVHVEQITRLTCPVWNAMIGTVSGQILLEAEAYSRSGTRGEDLIRMLSNYSGYAFLGDQATRELVKEYYQ